MKPHYYGPNSKKFWTAIWKLNKSDPEMFDALYDLGCKLQNLEGKVLRALNAYKETKRAK